MGLIKQGHAVVATTPLSSSSDQWAPRTERLHQLRTGARGPRVSVASSLTADPTRSSRAEEGVANGGPTDQDSRHLTDSQLRPNIEIL